MNILVSACLLGVDCRYDGTGCLLPILEELKERHHLIPICPEAFGGLPGRSLSDDAFLLIVPI